MFYHKKLIESGMQKPKKNMIFLVLRFNTEIPAETKLHFFKKYIVL